MTHLSKAGTYSAHKKFNLNNRSPIDEEDSKVQVMLERLWILLIVIPSELSYA